MVLFADYISNFLTVEKSINPWNSTGFPLFFPLQKLSIQYLMLKYLAEQSLFSLENNGYYWSYFNLWDYCSVFRPVSHISIINLPLINQLISRKSSSTIWDDFCFLSSQRTPNFDGFCCHLLWWTVCQLRGKCHLWTEKTRVAHFSHSVQQMSL